MKMNAKKIYTGENGEAGSHSAILKHPVDKDKVYVPLHVFLFAFNWFVSPAPKVKVSPLLKALLYTDT